MKLPAHAFRTFWAYHAWAGVSAGLVLHLMFLAGAVTLFLEPLRIWEEPAQHRPAAAAWAESPQALLERGLKAIERLPERPKRLWLGLPQGEAGAARFQYSDLKTGKWRAGWLVPVGEEGGAAGADGAVAASGQGGLGGATPGFVPEREQAASFIYHLHYLWHPALPEAEYLAGFLAMAFLLAVITGVLIHLKDLSRQLTQFRPTSTPGGRRVLWSDLHKVLGVMGLPFQLLYSYTGALLVFGPVLITAVSDPVFGGDVGKANHVAWNEPAVALPKPGGPAPSRSLDEILAITRAHVPGFSPISFGLQGYGREHGLVRAYGVVRDSDGVAGGGPSRYANVLLDHTTGEVLHIDAAATDLSSHATRRWISGVHYVYFGGDAVRALLALLSLAGCATILTGNWIWLSRRKEGGGSGARRPRLLARLTAGVGAGSFVAIAVLLVASRLIPLDAADRIAKEQQAFALALLACIAWALFARSTVAVWWRQLGLAGLLTLSLPFWAARLSSAGLFGGGPRIGTVVGVDVALLGVGALLLASAWAVRRAAQKTGAASAGSDPDPDPDPDSDSDSDPDPDPDSDSDPDRRRATAGLAKGTP